MASLIAWAKPNYPPNRTVDVIAGLDAIDFNAGVSYPFALGLSSRTIAYGGGPVGNHKHDDFLRLIPFPRPPARSSLPSPARSPLGLLQNPFGGSRSQGPGAPPGGR